MEPQSHSPSNLGGQQFRPIPVERVCVWSSFGKPNCTTTYYYFYCQTLMSEMISSDPTAAPQLSAHVFSPQKHGAPPEHI